jgi:hypothetical protein
MMDSIMWDGRRGRDEPEQRLEVAAQRSLDSHVFLPLRFIDFPPAAACLRHHEVVSRLEVLTVAVAGSPVLVYVVKALDLQLKLRDLIADASDDCRYVGPRR